MLIIFLICISIHLLSIDGFCYVLLSKRVSYLNSNDKYYDPFEEDPKLVEQFTSELNNIKTMTILDIKNEIFQIRNITKNEIILNSIKDRKEFECILARERVKAKLKVLEKKQDIVNYRQKMVTLLKEESDKIDMNYTNFKLVQELLHRGIKFDADLNRKDLILLLALDNLKYFTNNHDRFSDPDGSIEMANIFDTANVMTNFKEFADKYSTTFVSAVSNISDKIDIPHFIKNFTTSKVSNPTKSSSELYFKAIHGEIENLSNFDELVLWSKSQSKSKLTKFLIFSGIEVPQSASHKTVSSIFADFVLESRNKTKQFMSNSYISGSNINAYKVKSRKDIQDINSYDKLQLENEIIYEIWNKIISHKLFARLNQFIALILVRVYNLGVRLLHSSFVTGSLSSIQLMLALILKFLLKLSKWSSGNAMQPSNTLIAVALFTILTRGGIVKFIGTFILIKLFRYLSTLIFQMDHGNKGSFALF